MGGEEEVEEEVEGKMEEKEKERGEEENVDQEREWEFTEQTSKKKLAATDLRMKKKLLRMSKVTE